MALQTSTRSVVQGELFSQTITVAAPDNYADLTAYDGYTVILSPLGVPNLLELKLPHSIQVIFNNSGEDIDLLKVYNAANTEFLLVQFPADFGTGVSTRVCVSANSFTIPKCAQNTLTKIGLAADLKLAQEI